ncbi:hypothetical protein M1146_04580, partial [Patescibacteria group bacterium]|nr:hypothetical protein [Patescibacteria group bacterium]
MAVFVVMLVLGAFWYMNHKQRQPYTPLSVNGSRVQRWFDSLAGFVNGEPKMVGTAVTTRWHLLDTH